MSFIMRLALISLSAGSPISVGVLSTADEISSYSFQKETIDLFNFTWIFDMIADSIAKPFANFVSSITALRFARLH